VRKRVTWMAKTMKGCHTVFVNCVAALPADLYDYRSSHLYRWKLRQKAFSTASPRLASSIREGLSFGQDRLRALTAYLTLMSLQR
jgi:hypothetical protein